MSDNNSLFTLLDLPNDESIIIENVTEKDGVKSVEVSQKLRPTFCPICHNRMHSKGIYTRTVNHSIYQDRTTLELKIKQRRWYCQKCDYSKNDEFPFVEKRKRSTSLTQLLILDAMKDLNSSAISIAKRFNVSDSYVHDTFSQYVDLKRLKLPEYISIDEVFININDNMKYAFVIMDFVTGEIVDILHNRWSNTLEKFFLSIPLEERKIVKGVISDAYGVYQTLCEKYLPNAVQILDSFHACNFIIHELTLYINDLLRKYRNKQRKLLDDINSTSNQHQESIKDSKEIILLRDYRWVILKNDDDINYSYLSHFHKKLNMSLTTDMICKMFFDLDPNLEKMKNLKELYISFNKNSYSDVSEIESKLDELITIYRDSGFSQFIKFANFLSSFKPNIIRSFTTLVVYRKSKKDQLDYYARLSNGPMESFNRKPKDFKRNSRGFSNFDYTRNRILWATRINPPILAVPKPIAEVHSYKLDKRTLALRRKNKMSSK